MSTTYAEKLKLAAELRAGTGLANGLPDSEYRVVRKNKAATYLKSPPVRRKTGHERKSKISLGT